MSHLNPLVVALGIVCCAAVRASAQDIPAPCRTVLDAERKQITTPTHSFQTHDGVVEETISLPTAMYRLSQGKWKKYPITQKSVLDRFNQALAPAKGFSCQALADESLGGTPARVYRAHLEVDGAKNDGKIWIAKGSGMLLRQDSDVISADGQDKTHLSVRYDYTNVKAPAGVP